jgi:quercetin dioxygenase-like cupin family protein
MQHINDVKGRDIAPGLFGRFVHGETMTLSYVTIVKGGILKEHSHPHEQITFMLEGEMEMTIGGEKMILTPGMVHVIPGNVPHSAIAYVDCKVLDVFNPIREDYVIKD